MPHRRHNRSMFTRPVMTESGMLRGILSNAGYKAFLGIPFAAPPLGNLRWAPPKPVAPWSLTLDAVEMKPNCMQLPEYSSAQPRNALSEDCLYLNVWTPAHANASKLPVWLWLHGGSFHSGGSNESRLSGKWNAMQSDVIVVVANYRLNIFGFLASDALRKRDAVGGGSTGNYGILDQRAALRWVRSNIAQFGGDPSRVMLGGQSAGAASVYHHLVRPNSWGLFSRALAMSGGYSLILPAPERDFFERTFEIVLNVTRCFDASQKADRMASATLMDDGRSTAQVACLEQLPADVLLSCWRALQYDPAVRFEPVVDGVDLHAQPAALLRRGELAAGVPLLAGATAFDLEYPLWPAPSVRLDCDGSPSTCTREHLADFVRRLKPALSWGDEDAAQAVAAYGGVSDHDGISGARGDGGIGGGGGSDLVHAASEGLRTDRNRSGLSSRTTGNGQFYSSDYWYWAARRLGADYTMACPARRSARWLSEASGGRTQSYLYLFAHSPDGGGGQHPGSGGALHSSELPFAFRVAHAEGAEAAHFHINASREAPLADAMANAVITFAATGAPPVDWPAYKHDAEQGWMVFGAPTGDLLRGTVSHGLGRAVCDLWDMTSQKLENGLDLQRFAAAVLKPASGARDTVTWAMSKPLNRPATRFVESASWRMWHVGDAAGRGNFNSIGTKRAAGRSETRTRKRSRGRS